MPFRRFHALIRICLWMAAGPGLLGKAGGDRLDNYTDWAVYRGDKKANQYAELAQIHAANVHTLQPAWEYRTGDANEKSNMHSNPIVVDGLMYFTTPTLRAVAVSPGTGEEVWVFKAEDHHPEGKVLRGRSRGLVYWESGDDKRIFHGVKDRIYAINAKTGELIHSFGNGGHIDLRQHLGIDPEKASVEVTNPGIVYKNFLIVVSRVPEGYESTPGHIRAFDTVTGKFKWIFHTIPQKGEFGYDTWEFVEGEKYGGANAWGGLTLDEERGWVFGATGSPSFDFYGGNRKGMNLFGNCVLALDATTGERQWHYQTVHHDLWDYDNPSAPVLVTIDYGDRKRDAVVQFTKMGLTFVLDRDTGEPLFPVVETPVPPSTIEGEEAWPTQPIPTKPAPLNRLGFSEADITQITPRKHAYAKSLLERFLLRPLYTPPSEAFTIVQPGTLGGVEWHGGSFDPYSNIIYVNANDAPGFSKLTKPQQPGSGETLSEQPSKLRYLYQGYGFLTDPEDHPISAPPWGTLTAIDLASGNFVWRIPLGEYPELAERGIRNTGTPSFGGAVATAGGLVFIAATRDEKIRAFEKSRGRLLWEYQLPAAGYATPSVYMHEGRQYLAITCGGGGKNATKSGDSVMAFALPENLLSARKVASYPKADRAGWINLFDGNTLNGWVHMNGWHTYTVEDGAIVGRTAEGSPNSFLCSLQEFDDFELEVETMVDAITNQGIQFRSSARPVSERNHPNWRAGRVWGPQVEIRRGSGNIISGMLYGEALGTGWLSSTEEIKDDRNFFIPEAWNKIRLIADGPRLRTWVNGHLVEDLVREDVYQTHPKGFIGLQVHGITGQTPVCHEVAQYPGPAAVNSTPQGPSPSPSWYQ